MKRILIVFFFLAAGGVLADPPMRTVYSSSSTTNFSWTWPYHTTQKWTVVQTYPSPMDSSLRTSGRVFYQTPYDVSYYRYHNPQLTYQNEWGYFFPPHTRPIKNNGVVLFVAPPVYSIRTQ